MSHAPVRIVKRAKPKPPPSSSALPCFVLGVDPGKRAGWALWHRDELVQFGEVDGLSISEVLRIVHGARQLAEIARLPCVLVMEKPPTHHSKRSFTSLLGSGETRAAWRLAWLQCGGQAKRIVRVEVSRWRGAVMPGYGSGVSRAAVKQHEQRVAGDMARQFTRGGRILPVGEESAPAILIGRWGTRAGEVAAALPGRVP